MINILKEPWRTFLAFLCSILVARSILLDFNQRHVTEASCKTFLAKLQVKGFILLNPHCYTGVFITVSTPVLSLSQFSAGHS